MEPSVTSPISEPAPAASQQPSWSAPRASSGRRGDSGRAVAKIADKVRAGERISAEEALLLHEQADVLTIGELADEVRRRKHPERLVTYIVDRNINPTNVCITDCGFCAFYRRPKHEESYVLDRDVILEKVRETAELGGRQLLMQGGHHPYLKTDWWCDLIADMRARWPQINSHALSAPELDHLSKLDKRPVEAVSPFLRFTSISWSPGDSSGWSDNRFRHGRWLDTVRGCVHRLSAVQRQASSFPNRGQRSPLRRRMPCQEMHGD